MTKKQPVKKSVAKKSTPSSSAHSSNQKSQTHWSKIRAKLPPVFSESTTREDKLCLFSFCCGIILMACLFFADLFIRNYLESRRWEQQVLQTLQLKLQGYENEKTPPQIDGVILLRQQNEPAQELPRKPFQKKNNAQ